MNKDSISTSGIESCLVPILSVFRVSTSFSKSLRLLCTRRVCVNNDAAAPSKRKLNTVASTIVNDQLHLSLYSVMSRQHIGWGKILTQTTYTSETALCGVRTLGNNSTLFPTTSLCTWHTIRSTNQCTSSESLCRITFKFDCK